MIKLIEIVGDEYVTIPMPLHANVVMVEIASSDQIEYGILSFDECRKFEADEPFQKMEGMWFGPRKASNEFEAEYEESSMLVIWNSVRKRSVTVAYRFGERA